MSTVTWQDGLTLTQDPDAIRDYLFDFTGWLEGETVASAAILATNCTASISTTASTSVKIRVSAVQQGATVKVTPTTNSGQKDDFSVAFRVVQN